MKNIFEFLLTEHQTLNEEVFESFSHWMFDGSDETNTLARTFLRWSLLHVIKGSGQLKPDHSDFFAFFQKFDKIDLDSFLKRVSEFDDIARQVDQTLGDDPTARYSASNQSAYWYFMGIVGERIKQDNLFPDQPETAPQPSGDGRDQRRAEPEAVDDPGLSEEDTRSVSRVFAAIFILLLLGLFFFNTFISG